MSRLIIKVVALSVIATLINTSQGAVVYTNDFESGIGSEWSLATLDGTDPDFSTFSGRFNNNVQTLSVSNLVPGQAYSIFFDLYILDSWDGGSDLFNVDVDGTNLFRYSFKYNLSGQSYPDPPDVGPANLGFSGWTDSIYRSVEVVFSAVSNTAAVSFYGSGLQAISDESWGIDNILIEPMSATTMYTTSLPTGTVSTAIEWFTASAQRELSATATNAADYDLRSTGLDGTFGTADDSIYTLTPTFTSGRTVTFSIANNAPLQPGSYRFTTNTNLQDAAGGAVLPFTNDFVIAETAIRSVEDLDNGSLGTADSLNPLQQTPAASGFLTATAYGTFSSSEDDDYWSFDAEAGDRITAFVQVSRGDVNPYIRLRNASGSQLSAPNNWTDFTRLQDYVITTPGTYYLQLDPYYDRQPPASYTLRLDVARGRGLETEDNNNISQADPVGWTVDGSSLKSSLAGALEKNADYFNLGYLSLGNAMSVNVRFPDGSALSASNVNFEVQAPDGGVLCSTNTPLFAYDISTNTTQYLKISSPDLGVLSQYILDIVTLDSGTPSITADSLPVEGSTNSIIIDRLTTDFSEYMDLSTVTNPASWTLVSAGPDGLFGNGDDEPYTLSVSYAANTLQASFSITDGPLQPDRNYRFTATTNLTDRVGNPMATARVREFRLENIPLYIHESRSNGSVATGTPLGALTNAPDGSVSLQQTIGVGDNPVDAITADLDGDLNPDVIICNYNSDSLTILSGSSSGQFSVSTNLPAGDGPRQAVLGHFNADAFWDLAVANDYGANVGVYLGQSGGTFAAPVTVSTLGRPFDIKAADFNGDTFTDLITIHQYVNQITVLFGDGNGNFGSSTNYPTGAYPQEVSVGNFNADSYPDVAVANFNADNVSVYTNNGDGTLSAPMYYPAGDGPRCIKVGDVDNDSNLDLIVGNFYGDSVSVFMGAGDGSFAAATNYNGCNGPADVELVDLDSDGFKDIAVASYDGYRLNFFNNQGDGTFAFSAFAHTINYYPHSIAVADYTKDGFDDLLVVNPYYDQVHVFAANAEIILPEDPAGSGLRSGFGRGNITSTADYDYWSFSGNAGDHVLMAIDVPGNPNSSGLRYRLVSPTGADLGTYSAASQGQGQSPVLTLSESGRYAIMVYYNYTYWGEYRVRVSKVPASFQMDGEVNDSIGAANALTFEPVGGGRLDASLAGAIGTGDGSGDYYSLGNLTSGTVVNVSVATPSTSPLAAEIGLFGVDNTLVAFTSNLVLRLGGTAADYGIVNPVTNFPTTAFTAEFWMKTADGSKAGCPVSYARSGQDNELLLFDYRNFQPHVGGSYYATGISANNDRWNHIAWTWDSVTGTSLLYKNGVLVHSNGNWRTAYNMVQNGAFVVGQDQDNLGGGFATTEAFLGELDELRIWNVVRSPSEIQAAMGSSLTGSEPGLIGYWSFESGTAADLTGNANDLVLFGNSQVVTSDRTDPTAWPTNFQYMTTTDGVYRIRVRDALGQAGLPYQYVLGISLQDAVPPAIAAISLPAQGSTVSNIIDRFNVTFTEEMDAASVNVASNYDLRAAGTDGLFDTPDDELYSVVPTYSSGLTASYVITDGPLQPGLLRFTATTGLLDRAGLAMAADHLRTFSVALPSGFIMEDRSNDSAVTATSLGTLMPGESDGSLVLVGYTGVGSNPYALVMTNFNGDAYPDIATANFSSDNVSILLGNGDGTFVSATNIYSGGGAVGIEAGRLNADTNIDLAVVNYHSDTVTVLLGDGAGGFVSFTNQYAGDAPRDVSIADMNNDGTMDLVVCNEYSDNVGVLLGNGDGSFSSVISQYCGDGPFAVAVGDLNGDGTNDVATANNNAGTMSILLGNGDGSLQAAIAQSSGTHPRGITIADLNSDLLADILMANLSSDNMVFYRGLGGGSFTNIAAPYIGSGPWGDLPLHDLNGDGRLDVAAALYSGSQLATLQQQPDGSFGGLARYPIAGNPIDVAAGDINGDGLTDFATANYNGGSVAILLANKRELLDEDPPGSGLFGNLAIGNIADSADNDYWSFSAHAGDTATVALSIPGFPTAARLQAAVFGPDGSSLGSWSANYTGGSLQSPPITLPSSGRYTVRVSQYDAYRGEYHLAVQVASPPLQVESEANDAIGSADTPTFTLSAGQQEASVAGFDLQNTGYDYYSLGNIASGTVIRATLELPSFHNMIPQLEVVDGAGNVIHLAATGTAQVVNFDGASDYVRTTTTNFNPRSGTVAGWVYPRESQDWGFWQTHDSASQNWADWFAMFSYPGDTFYLRVGNGSSYQDVTFNPSSGTVPAYQWTHLASTWEGSTLRLYVNGTLRASRNDAVLQDVMDPYARMGIGHGRWLDGWLEDMSVWNRALSQSEIQALENGPLTGSESGLVGYWDFNGDVLDASSSGNDGQLFDNATLVTNALSPHTVQTNLEYSVGAAGIYYVRVNSGYGGLDVRSQYLVHLSTFDSTKPVITGETLPAAGSTNFGIIDGFSVSFSEEMEAATVTNGSHFELRGAGADDLFGTGDDETYALAITYSSGLSATFDVTDGPLQPGWIRFMAGTNVTDRSGTPLEAYTNVFRIGTVPGYLFESRGPDGGTDPGDLNTAATNLPDGTYTVTQTYATGSQPLDMISGLFNGDTNADLAVVNFNSDSLSILLGNGDTTFVLSTNIAIGNGPHAVVSGDFSADNNLDLAVAKHYDDNITVLLGNGTGGFSNAASYYCGDGPTHMVSADLDGDGLLDLVTANQNSDDVGVLLGNGDGSFDPVVRTYSGNGTYGVAVADLNGDGTNDVAAGNRYADTLSLLIGQGGGVLSLSTNLVVGNEPRRVVAADLNLDGIIDLAVGNYASDTFTILMGTGGGGFAAAQSSWIGDAPWLYAQDVDGDGVLDLLSANGNSDSIGIGFGDGFGRFAAPQVSAVGDGPVKVLAAQFDAQPGLELAVINYNAGILQILTPDDTTMLAADSADGAVRTQHGRGVIRNASDMDYWTFEARSGQQLCIGTEMAEHGTYLSRLRWRVYRPDGAMIIDYISSVNGYGQSSPVKLPVGGRYLLTVQQYDAYYGEYRFRVNTVDPPRLYESENNDSTGNADAPSYVLQPGSRSAQMAGFIQGNDTSGDYFQLGNLGVGTAIGLTLDWPQSSMLEGALEIYGPQGLVAQASPATNLVHVTATNGNFYARVLDASTSRGLDAQYLLDLSLSDATAPEITSVSLPAEGTESTALISSFSIGFSEAMDTTTVTNPANYELRGGGLDGLLDTADDEIYPLVPGSYSGGSSLGMSISGAPLQPGPCRLTISTALEDILGNGLAVSYVRNFSIGTLPGMVNEDRDNNSPAMATPLPMTHEILGLLRGGGARGALLNSSDVDYYSFTGYSNETVSVGADSPAYGTYHRLRFRIVDTNDTVLAEMITPHYTERGQTTPITLPADGTYYVRVSPYDNWFGEYRIHVLAAATPPPLETEDNGTIGTANVLSMSGGTSNSVGRIAGYVGHAADNDYYAIGPVTNGQTILVGVRVPDQSGLVPVVSVYNAAGAYQTEEGATGDGSAEVRVTTSNNYYVVVRSGENTGGLGKDYVMDVEVLPTASVVIPNLGVTQVGPPSGSGIKSGDSVQLSYSVQNIGSAPIIGSAWFDRVVLSGNKVMGDADDYPLGTFPHAGDLAVGEAYTNLQTVTLPEGISGNYYIVVYTDFGDLVYERLFEGDNIAASVSTFAVALADYPDVKVENLSVSGSNEVGQVLSIDWNTANRGAAAVPGNVTERLRIVRSDNGAELYSRNIIVSAPLAIDAVVPHSISYTTSVAVAHQVTVDTDFGNSYYEFDATSHASAEQNSASVIMPVYNYYNVSVAANPPAGGAASGGGHFRSGTIVHVNATVNTNVLPYAFFNWTEYGAFRSSSTNYAFMLTRNFNLTANFGLPQFASTAVRVPVAGGSVTGTGLFDYGTTNVLRAYPNPGYGFDHWQEGAVQRGSALTVTNVLYGDREMTAYFYELNPYHTVTTASDPAGVAAVSGAGYYTNGNTTVFAAPQMTTNGANRYIFQRLELNGGYLSGTNVFNNTFTTLQPSNMQVVARYTGQPLEPQVKSVIRNLSNPVPATTNFLMDVVFDRSMDPGTDALVIFTNTAVPAMTFTASSNGMWVTTWQPNDTFRLTPIGFAAGDDGDYGVLVSQAVDLYGAAIGPTNAATVQVNSTPPDNPVFSVVSSNATSVTLDWSGYSAPSDLAGFRLYRETNAFTSVTGLAPVAYLSASASGGVVGGIQLDTDHWLGVAAVDVAGNVDPAVNGLFARVDSVLPPAVPVTATPVGADAVDLSWTGYSTAGLFGLEGFRVYRSTSLFSDVSSMTPFATLPAGQKTLRVENLDRSTDHYFAVVGYNRLDQYVSSVTAALWKDPFGGTIAVPLLIGAGGAPSAVYDIYRDIVVVSNAVLTIEPGVTLRFHAGTGLRIENGALNAQGTVFRPITLTSAQPMPAPGDWSGLYLGPNAGASQLSHVWITYGAGLTVDSCEPSASALSLLFNTPAGLRLDGTALLDTADLLAQFNDIGLQQDADGQLILSNSIVLNNSTNAYATGTNTVSAPGIWWGSTNNTEVQSGIVGNVDYAPFLTTEPLLTPAADTYDGLHSVGSRSVPMRYACRVAESMRVSEDSTFAGAFFMDFAASNTVLLSEGGGAKTLYIQYRNVNGETNAPIVLPLTYVTAGPSITTFNLTEGQLLERPLIVHCAADSPLGVAALEFYIDGALAASTNAASMNVLWDVRTETIGIHRVKLLARDTHGAFTVSEANVTVSPVPPPVPMIGQPTNGTVTAAASVVVQGTAEPLIDVRISRNAAVVGTTVADVNGSFSVTVPLVEGANNLVATAYDALGSANSAPVTVVRDTGAPAALIMESPTFSVTDGIGLQWTYPASGEQATSFKVYWSNQPFTNAAQATASGTVVYGLNYVVNGLADGTYYFGVIGFDGAGNASPLSNVVSAEYDTTPPAFSIGYNKSSPVGPGTLVMVLESDEALSGPPDLLVLPSGASGPLMLVVSNTAPNTFQAELNVTSLTPSGPAQVRVSASDIYGNAFSGAPTGMVLVIDTTPPSGTIETTPAEPVQLLSSTAVQVNLTLTEPPKAGTVPQVTLNPPVGATLNIPMSGAGTNWSGNVTLDPLNGNGFCVFNLSVADALDNTGTTITSGGSLEIYNTALPTPPDAPNLLNPVSAKGGYVNLLWYPVSNAETYNVYRIPGDAGIPTVKVASGIVSNAFADLPPADGQYRYAVTAERRGAESGFSQIYTKISDRTPPGAPTNMTVQLQASGVQVNWSEPSAGETPLRYHIYRNGSKIRSTYVPTPVNDYPPRGTSVYVVASADWLENEAFSATNEFVMLVPAVASFEVLMNESQPPSLSWVKGDGSIVGVNLYRNGIKLNTAPLTGTSFVDSSYSGSSLVSYELRSVDSLGQEGPGRIADVYRVDMGLDINGAGSGVPLLHYFDDYGVSVTNRTLAEAFPLETIELRRTYSGSPALTVVDTVTNSIAAGGAFRADAAMASMSGAAAQSVRLRLMQTPNASGATVIYQRLFSFSGALVANPEAEVTVTNTPILGTLQNFKVRLFNRGLTDMDVVLMKSNGSQPGDVYVSLLNDLGVEVSRGEFRGSLPGMQIAPNGNGYVTIPAGGHEEVWVRDVLVPVGLESSVVAQGGASHIYHRYGTAGQQESGPISGSTEFSLTLSEYYGTSATDKASYANDEQIMITGQALRRSDGTPLPNTALHIGFAIGEYRWFEDVTTDGTGAYSLAYDVPDGISGELAIWAAHPDVVDRLDQTTVGIYRMFVLPRFGDIRMSKNDIYRFSLTLLNPGTVPLEGLGATVQAYQMVGTNKVPIATVTATPDLTVTTINGEERLTVPVELQAAINAPDNAVVEIRFASSVQGAADTFTGNLTLLEAVPIVDVVEPASGYVDMTVNRGHVATRTVTLVNRGVRDYLGVKMAPAATHSWMYPSLVPNPDGTYNLPDMPVGASNTFDVVYAPPEGIALDRYSDTLVISGTNHPATFNVPLYATVSSADKGAVQMFVQNTLSIPVPGATMRLRNRLLGTELTPVKTDTNGVVLVENLQEGLWFWQVSAPGHTTQAGSVEVVPDQTVEIETRLTKNVVTVNFSVVPVPFTDRYEIVLEQTFETHVPQPVLVVTPAFQQFEDVEPGFTARYVMTAKNYGLIQLNDVVIEGQSFDWGSVTPLIQYLPRLKPFQEVEIPVVIVYNGDGTVGGQSQQGYADCVSFMFGAIDNFGQNLLNLINKLHGDSICPSSVDPLVSLANNNNVLVKKALEKVWDKLSEYMTPTWVMKAAALIGCAFEGGGGGSGNGGPGGPSNSGGTSYGGGNPKCFAPQTQILLADGLHIEAQNLAVGDRVRSGPGKNEIAEVAEVVHSIGRNWVTLTFEDDPEQTLTVTDEHLIWIDGKGWTAAVNVLAGDAVFTEGGMRIKVASVKAFEAEQPLVSVRLKGDNALYAEGILVHDQCGWWSPPEESFQRLEVAP